MWQRVKLAKGQHHRQRDIRRTICIVEIKRRNEIRREIIDEVDAKVRSIARPDGVSVRAALVFDGHISPGVAADGYFNALIPFQNLII